MPTFSNSLEKALHQALTFANDRHHEYATLEHLLLALMDDSDAAAVMRACGVDLDALRSTVTEYIDNELHNLVTGYDEDSKPTSGFQRVIQRAVIHVQSSGRDEVTGANVLVAIFAERESHAAYFLQEQEMTRYDAVNFISHGIAKRPGGSESRPVRGAEESDSDSSSSQSDKRGGRQAEEPGCAQRLLRQPQQEGADGKVDPLIGREKTRSTGPSRCCAAAPRTTRSMSVIPGVGKTAIAEGLARRIINGEVPEVLLDSHHLCPRHGLAAGRNALSR